MKDVVIAIRPWIFLLLCVPGWLIASEGGELRPDTVTIAVHRYYPYYVDGKGMGADIYRAAFATQGIRVVLREYPIMRGVSKMLNHHVDGFSPGTLFIHDQQSLARVTAVPSFIINAGWLYKGTNNPLEIDNLHGTTLVTLITRRTCRSGLSTVTWRMPRAKKGR